MTRAAEDLILIFKGLILFSQAFADVGKNTCAPSVGSSGAKDLFCVVL